MTSGRKIQRKRIMFSTDSIKFRGSLLWNSIGCVQTLLISFQRGSPPVESAHRRPNPCSVPRAIPSLEEPSH